MADHEMGILGFLALGMAIMFIPTLRLRRTAPRETVQESKPPEKWQLWLAGLAFLQACLFAMIGIVCEAAGTHWIVGLFCVLASLLCSTIVLWLFGLRPRQFID